ncbi:MAG: hypothetical protein RMA76_32255 [Deltaproteobacteria bacterium]
MKRAVLLLALLAACRPEATRAPLPGRVKLVLEPAPNLVVTHPVRLAVVWVTSEVSDAGEPSTGYVVTLDQVVTSTTITLDVVAPPADQIDLLSPKEAIGFGFNGNFPTRGNAYRPRFVVYEDLDDSGSFDARSLEDGGPDRVIGADSSFNAFVAYVFDIESILSQMSSEQFALYETATNGRFTAFVGVVGTLDDLAIAAAREASIVVSDSDVPSASVRCRHQIFGTQASPIDVSVTVNPPLDPLVVCGTTATECAGAPLMSLPPPVVVDEDEEPLGGITCRRNAQLEMLTFHSQRVRCDGCGCYVDETARAFATTATSAPTWWPCPDPIGYCLEGPVAAFTSTCAVAR